MTTITSAKYGVHLNIAPSVTGKVVRLHHLPCPHYKQQRNTRKGTYSFNKNCETFADAIKKASEQALEWHAPIKLCQYCAEGFESN